LLAHGRLVCETEKEDFCALIRNVQSLETETRSNWKLNMVMSIFEIIGRNVTDMSRLILRICLPSWKEIYDDPKAVIAKNLKVYCNCHGPSGSLNGMKSVRGIWTWPHRWIFKLLLGSHSIGRWAPSHWWPGPIKCLRSLVGVCLLQFSWPTFRKVYTVKN